MPLPMNQDTNSHPLVAFCHIEKAAGTSLIHVLRRVLFLRYAAVRPLTRRSQPYFTDRDLRIVKRLNPFLRGIGGHAVVPHSDLLGNSTPIAFITQVRDPIARTISQYRFRIRRLKKNADPEAFLRHPVANNFQVRKIAGCQDLEQAKSILRHRFWLAGPVDDFDSFLVLLARRMRLPLQLFTYRRQNITAQPQQIELPDGFREQLREQNQLDLHLVDWIGSELFPKYLEDYDGDFDADLRAFQELQKSNEAGGWRSSAGYLFRNAYWKPATGAIRVLHGIPFNGSYTDGK